MAKSSEFSKTAHNTQSTPSSSTNVSTDHKEGARTGVAKSRGVENPIPEDMALIGDTSHGLHKAALPRRTGPNFGYGEEAPSDAFRVESGNGVAGDL